MSVAALITVMLARSDVSNLESVTGIIYDMRIFPTAQLAWEIRYTIPYPPLAKLISTNVQGISQLAGLILMTFFYSVFLIFFFFLTRCHLIQIPNFRRYISLYFPFCFHDEFTLGKILFSLLTIFKLSGYLY